MTNYHHEKDDTETGIIYAVLKEFSEHRIPRLIQMEAEVKSGVKLSELDMSFLEECLAMTKGSSHFAKKHPEYEKLVGQVASMYHKIATEALDAEKASND